MSELIDKNPDSVMITKRENAIKMQFTRSRSGSMTKFKILLNRYLRKRGIDYTDLMN